jgi:hypothetical protein
MISDVWLTETEYQQIVESRNKLDADFAALQAEVTLLKSQIIELQSYKNENEFVQEKAEIESTLESFEPELSNNSEFTELKKNITSAFEKHELFITVENLEKELFSMVGRKKFEVQKPKKIISRVAIIDTKPNSKSEFGENEKYFTNNGGR